MEVLQWINRILGVIFFLCYHMLPLFRAHGQNLNSINEGMKREVEKQMRSERMKANNFGVL